MLIVPLSFQYGSTELQTATMKQAEGIMWNPTAGVLYITYLVQGAAFFLKS